MVVTEAIAHAIRKVVDVTIVGHTVHVAVIQATVRVMVMTTAVEENVIHMVLVVVIQVTVHVMENPQVLVGATATTQAIVQV